MPNCPICKASRWKDPKKTKGKKVANKVVRYFPLTPRLQRMFNTKHIACYRTTNLDVMHIEKNALEALLNTLLQNDKSKDTLKAMQDLETLRVRKELWLVKKPNGKFEKPHPKYSFTAENKKRFFCISIKGGCCVVVPYTTVLEVDAAILASRVESPDNVETSFPAWFNYKLFSLACGPTSACTYPACIVNGVKFVVHERDILHTTQCSGVSTPGLDGEMYYGQLERNSGSSPYFRPPQGCLVSMTILDFINNEDDVVAHVLDDDDVVMSDDDEVNLSAICSMLRLETGNRSLRKAFRENNKQPLQLGFDYDDLGPLNRAYEDVMTMDQMTQILWQTGKECTNSQSQRPHYTLLTNPHMNDSRSCDQLAQDLACENNNECSSREEEEEEEGEQQSDDDYLEEE
ncbi:hypothetical protein Tco_0594717 [Tanacetum coccineum]